MEKRKQTNKQTLFFLFEITNIVKNITTESGINDMKIELQGKHKMKIETIVSFLWQHCFSFQEFKIQ